MASTASVIGRQSIESACGDCPPYTDYSRIVEDPYNKNIYMIGGYRSGDPKALPSPNFYSCETAEMRWTNLTDHLIYRNPYNPFSEEEETRSTKRLPLIGYPGVALLRIRNTSFVAVFGGYDAGLAQARDSILLINPNRREWWILQIEGPGVEPRIDPVVAAIGNSIYVFSGFRGFDQNKQPYQAHRSYCIADFSPDTGCAHWSTRDAPYPTTIPANQYIQVAFPVYNGKKILLTPGRMRSIDWPHDFTSDNVFFFHVVKKIFQSAVKIDIAGAFPSSIHWYSIFRPLKEPSVPDSSVIICGFRSVPGTPDIAPELWYLHLTPEERVECLNFIQRLWDLDLKFQDAIYVKGRVRILGTDAEDDHNAKWNIYIDIPTR